MPFTIVALYAGKTIFKKLNKCLEGHIVISYMGLIYANYYYTFNQKKMSHVGFIWEGLCLRSSHVIEQL